MRGKGESDGKPGLIDDPSEWCRDSLQFLHQAKEWKSFLNSTGQTALNQRGIMNEFFLMDNMKNLAKRIQVIVSEYIHLMISEQKLNFSQFKEVDWKKYSELIFDDIVN